MSAGEIFLRDVIDIPESVHAGDFKVELSGGFRDTQARVDEYVVTDQLRQAFSKALGIVRAAVRGGSSYAAYLHGSFGSGKSHFLTVLHAILNNDPAARAKPGLQPVIADHDGWLRGRKFLMVPYHLVGATDLGSAVLGGYVNTVRRLHPGAPTPPVYRADAMLADARRQREFLADDAKFVEWLGTGSALDLDANQCEVDDLDVIDAVPVSGWTSTELDRAFT
ncbi:MAG: PglY protein, partial [Pseudonocardiaceae bacterium]